MTRAAQPTITQFRKLWQKQAAAYGLARTQADHDAAYELNCAALDYGEALLEQTRSFRVAAEVAAAFAGYNGLNAINAVAKSDDWEEAAVARLLLLALGGRKGERLAFHAA